MVLQELLRDEQEGLNYFFENLDLIATQKLLDTLAACQGMIVFTGVGKSGLVAEKIALTMTSTNSRALYISPINALHGDIGIVSSKDIFIMISKSGESEELFNIIPTLRNKKVPLIGIVSNPKSRLAKACDQVLCLPLKKELCPFDLVPTTSTVIQMIYGDILAVALMRMKNFTLDDYALNHPAGRIGKRISLRVRDLMVQGENIPLCSPNDKLMDILVELSHKRCGCILIVDEEKRLLGVFTDGDLRRSLQKIGSKALEAPISELMTKSPRWIDPEKLAWEAMDLMELDQKNAITVLPVLNSDRTVAGLIKLHDIVQSGI